MKLSLKNFKCWDNRTFDLQDKGIVLITGKSGKRKNIDFGCNLFCLVWKG